MKLKMSFMFIGGLALLTSAREAGAQEPVWPKAIADNSFLIEEAYNQEQGVVQHISTFFQLPGPPRASTTPSRRSGPSEGSVTR